MDKLNINWKNNSNLKNTSVQQAISDNSTKSNLHSYWFYYKLAGELALQGKLDEAISTYRQAIALSHHSAWSYYGLGKVLFEVGRRDEALACFQKAIEINPNFSWAYHSVGQSLAQGGDRVKAIASYRQAAQLNPDFADVYQDLGKALVENDQWQAGIISYRQGMGLKPSLSLKDFLDYIKNYYLAKLNILKPFPSNDTEFLHETANLSDRDFVQMVFRAYLQRSVDEQGVTELVKVLQEWKTRENFIAKFVQPSGEFQYLRHFLSSAPQDVFSWRLGTYFILQGKLDEAIAAYYQALTLKPDLVLAYSSWANSLAKQNKVDNEVAFRAKFLNTLLHRPYTAELYACFGELFQARHKLDEAIEAYQKVLTIEPNYSQLGEVYFRLGQLFQQKNRIAEAEKYYQKSIDLLPNNAETYYNLGFFSYQQNQLDLAFKYVEKLINLEPKSGKAYLLMGHILSINNQIDEAITYYKQALQNPPVHHHAYTSLAQCLASQNQFDEAVLYLQESIDEKNPVVRTEVLKTLSDILQKQGKQEEAKVYLQKLETVSPPKGVYKTTKEWAAKSGSPQVNYIDLHPAHQVKIPLPKTIDGDVHPHLKAWSNFKSPATFVATLPQGRYCQLHGINTAYITGDNYLLLDVSSGESVLSTSQNPNILSNLNFPPVHHVNGKVAVLSGNTSQIYYHWIVDSLPKLGLMEKSGIDLNSIDKFVVSRYSNLQKSDFHKETLDILGIPPEKIIDSSKYPHIKAEQLIVSSYPGIVCLPTKWAIDFLKSKFLSTKSKSNLDRPERIYISRRIAGTRRIINEDEVIELLESLGFVTITGESMSIAEKIELMSNAKVVLSQHSGGGTNLLFCNPGTKVIEVFTPNNIGMCYYIMSNHLGLEYYYLIGEAVGCSYLRHLIYEIDGFEDTLINIDSLKALLKMAGVN